MRLIKFRAWDGSIMWDEVKVVTNGFYYPNNSITGHSDDTAKFSEWNENQATIMQFTGLHDKNGEEIYEGDIVQYKSNEVGTLNTINEKMEIFWNEKEAKFDTSSRTLGIDQYGLEVIGNIYENPELLKGK